MLTTNIVTKTCKLCGSKFETKIGNILYCPQHRNTNNHYASSKAIYKANRAKKNVIPYSRLLVHKDPDYEYGFSPGTAFKYDDITRTLDLKNFTKGTIFIDNKTRDLYIVVDAGSKQELKPYHQFRKVTYNVLKSSKNRKDDESLYGPPPDLLRYRNHRHRKFGPGYRIDHH